MVKKLAQRAIVAGLSGLMTLGAVAPAAMAVPAGNYWLESYPNIAEKTDDAVYWKRIAGSNRYGTMKAIVEAYTKYKAWFATGDRNASIQMRVAVLASGENYPDALAANGLAGSLNAPVILTEKGKLTTQAKELLQALSVQTVFIMGGTSSVSQEVEDAVKALHIATSRVAGTDRQGTSLAAYKLIDGNWYKNSGAKDLIIASGANYADALSISPYAYRVGAPIVLTKADGTLTDEAIDEIAKNKYIERVIILGGKDSVKSSVVDAVEKYDKYGRRNFEFVRLGGENRYKTSALIAEWEVKEWYANNAWGEFSFDTCYVADGENYPDALAGGQLAGGYWNDTYMPAPLLLVKDGDSTAEALIKSEIGDSDYKDGRENICIDENRYNAYVGNVVYEEDDPQYVYADAWYGTNNTYFVRAAWLMDGAKDYDLFGTSGITIKSKVIEAGKNGRKVYRNLGQLNSLDKFYGYILGGVNSVSKDKAKSLDKAVKDELDDLKNLLNKTPTDDFLPDSIGRFIYADEAKNFTSVDDFDYNADNNNFIDYFKLEYDGKYQGVDRWIVKAPYGNKWKRVEGIYAYANEKDVLYNNGFHDVWLKETEWLFVGETHSAAGIDANFDWWRVICDSD
jgi:putative cell wall-binding protein